MDVAERKAYIVGSGLVGLSAAVFLIRDGQMPGENISIFEELPLPGGGCDGIKDERLGYIIRGAEKWKTILSIFGICTVLYRH